MVYVQYLKGGFFIILVGYSGGKCGLFGFCFGRSGVGDIVVGGRSCMWCIGY